MNNQTNKQTNNKHNNNKAKTIEKQNKNNTYQIYNLR